MRKTLDSYTLTQDDADAVNGRRIPNQPVVVYDDTIGEYVDDGNGRVIHKGNSVAAGESYPLLIIKTHEDNSVNGQVFLDGNDTLWVTSVKPDSALD